MAGRCGCSSTCGCCSTASATIAVSGSGGAGNCLSHSAVIAPQLDNRLSAEPDGLLVTQCATGPDGQPLDVDPVTGCVVVPPPVILDYAGVIIPPNPGGEIPLPTAGLPPAFDCGLTTLPGGELVVDASGAWPAGDVYGAPFVGNVEAVGSPIYCDPNGQLRGVPQSGSATNRSARNVVNTLFPVSGTYATSASLPLAVGNPSTAREFTVMRVHEAEIDILVPPDGGCELRLQERIDGGVWATVAMGKPPEIVSGSDTIRTRLQLHSIDSGTVPAGGGQTFETRIQVTKTGSGADPTLASVDVGVTVFGVSR